MRGQDRSCLFYKPLVTFITNIGDKSHFYHPENQHTIQGIRSIIGVKLCRQSITAVPELKTGAPGGAFDFNCTRQEAVMMM